MRTLARLCVIAMLFGFSADADAQNQELVFPIVVNGIVNQPVHYQTTFTIVNLSDRPVEVGVHVFDKDGTQGGVFCGPVEPVFMLNRVLEPHGQFHVSTSPDRQLRDGWARITWQGSANLLATAELALISGPPEPCLLKCNRSSDEIVTTSQIPAIKSAREFRAPVAITPNRHTAFALVNPSPTEVAHVTFKLLDSSGNRSTGGNLSIEIPPRARVSALAWTFAVWCPPCLRPADPPPPEMFHGSASITSDIPIAVGALNMLLPEGKFVGVPVAVP